MNNIIERKWKQGGMVNIEDLRGTAFQAEELAHTFRIRGVDESGEAMALSGSVGAVFLRADNTDVTITGAVSGGVASITLPEECYSMPGRFGLTVYLTSEEKTVAIYAAIGSVSRTSSGNVSPESAADIADLISRINAAVETIPEEYQELENKVDDIYLPACNSVEKSKNLLTINPAFIGTVNGVTIGWSADGEKITLDGTSDAMINIPVMGTRTTKVNLPAGTYTFTLSDLVGINTNSPLSVKYNYEVGATSTTIVNQASGSRQSSIEFTQDANVFIQIQSGITYSSASFRLQIEAGDEATSYQKPAGMIDHGARGSIEKLMVDLKVNAESYDIAFERFQNIQYVDMMNDSGIAAMDSGRISADYKIRFRNMPFSIKCTTNASEASTRFRIPQSVSVPMAGTEEIELYLYTTDAASIGGSHVIRLTGVTSGFSRNIDTALQNGWNKIRIPTEGAGTIDYTTSETEWRLYVYSTASATVWIGGIFAVKPDKANIIITDDGPYQSFYENAYPALAAIGVPVTWAGDWSKIGVSDKLITQEELNLLAYDGISEFSFHNWDGTEQAEGTALSALRDTVNNIRYLQANGLQADRIWRAAWQGNNCAHPELANELVDASASHDGSTGVVQFPFQDRFNIPRWAMQGRSTSTVDTWFSKLERQHCTMMMYTHGISDGDKDVSEELLAYYVEKIEAGIQAGWLNATTYSRMMNHYRRI